MKGTIMAMKRVLLARLWDGHPSGQTVEVEDATAESMVRKGYGQIVTEVRRPVVETTIMPIVAEQAVTTPEPEPVEIPEAEEPKKAGRKGRKVGN